MFRYIQIQTFIKTNLGRNRINSEIKIKMFYDDVESTIMKIFYLSQKQLDAMQNWFEKLYLDIIIK